MQHKDRGRCSDMEPRDRIIAVTCIPDLSISNRLRLLDLPLSSRELLSLTEQDLHQLLPPTCMMYRQPASGRFHFDSLRLWLSHPENRMVWYGDSSYPPLLREIPDPPFLLTYIGNLADAEPALSIVGTREPTEQGSVSAFALALQCADIGTLVVTGYNRGIERAAQEGALALQGRIWTVLAGGLSMVEHRQGRHLEHIVSCGGALISEFHPFARVRRWHVPLSARIISALSPVTVLIQAPAHSPAMVMRCVRAGTWWYTSEVCTRVRDQETDT